MSRRTRYEWACAVLDEHGDIQAWDHAHGGTVKDLKEVLGWVTEEEGGKVALVKLIGCDDRTDWFPADERPDEEPIFEDGSDVPTRYLKQWRSQQQ